MKYFTQIYVVGDIHGCNKLLKNIQKTIKPQKTTKNSNIKEQTQKLKNLETLNNKKKRNKN